MSKSIRFLFALALATSLAGSLSFAQSGEAVYKARCQSCHGAAGVPNPGIAKMMGVKPITATAVKSTSEADMVKDTANGVGKMQPFKGKISDAEIKASVQYFRSLAK
ncbi:MAG TPA: cytochrome c [Terracidiphilus sp.]|nr:cytochrome c [Terracidiphilus sp.]